MAVELPIGNSLRIVTGTIISEEANTTGVVLRIEVDDVQGQGGSPILNVHSTYLRSWQRDIQFGCDFFLKLAAHP